MSDDKKPNVTIVTRHLLTTADAKLPSTSWALIEAEQGWRQFRDSFQRHWLPQEEAK